MDGHEPSGPDARTGRGSGNWLSAVIRGTVMLVASVVAFVLVPNQLLTYLSLHAAPRVRDLLVTTWWMLAFVACCVLFLRLQRGRAR